MELRHLRYFTAVYSQQSISRAAELLRMSQPALSRQLADLEREMGAALFERVPAGVRPTPAGIALQGHASRVLQLADATREVVVSAVPARERVEIGLPPGLPRAWLQNALREIERHVPAAQVSFVDASSGEQLKLLREGRIDIAIVHQPPPRTVHEVLLFEQPFGVAVRPGHRLAGAQDVPLRDLDGVPVLLHSREQIHSEHEQMISVATELGISPQWRFARFTENALLCAEATGADAVLLSQPSAVRLLPAWPWVQVTDPAVPLRTWAARLGRTRTVVAASWDTIAAVSPGGGDAALSFGPAAS